MNIQTADKMESHMKLLHDLPVNLAKLLDEDEKDPTARMIKSLEIIVEPYKELHLQDIQCREDISKARILTKKCFEESSKVMQEQLS